MLQVINIIIVIIFQMEQTIHNETGFFSFIDQYTIVHVQTLNGRDRCEHGLPKRLQLERRNGGGLALTTGEGPVGMRSKIMEQISRR